MSDVYISGEVHIDFSNLWIQRGEHTSKLRPKTAEVLYQLVLHAGLVVSKEFLLTTVWPGVVIGEWGLTTCIYELRQALQDTTKPPSFIETVHRRGYRFIAPLTAQSVMTRQAFPILAQATEPFTDWQYTSAR